MSRTIMLLGWVWTAALLVGLAGCAAQRPVARSRPARVQSAAQTHVMVRYGHAMMRQMQADRVLGRILVRHEVRAPLDIGLLVEPDGFVKNAVMVRARVAAPVAKAIERHLLYVNFGRFLPGMPARTLYFALPITPPAADAVARLRAAPAKPGFRIGMVALYQPQSVLVARVGSAGPLAYYIQQTERSLAALFDAEPVQPGLTAAVVIGVKPGLRSRVWVVRGGNDLPGAMIARIKAVARAVPPVVVHHGPIAFALLFNVWGGGRPITNAQHPVPMPKQWFQGAPPGNVVVPDGVFARIWR